MLMLFLYEIGKYLLIIFLPAFEMYKRVKFHFRFGCKTAPHGDWLSCTQQEVKFDTIILLKCGEKIYNKLFVSISTQEQQEDLIKQIENSVIFTNAKTTESDLKSTISQLHPEPFNCKITMKATRKLKGVKKTYDSNKMIWLTVNNIEGLSAKRACMEY